MSLPERQVHQMPSGFQIHQLQTGTFAKDYPEILTMEDVAKILRIGRSTAYELARHVDFPSVHIGRTVRVHKVALLEWIRQQGRG